MCPLFRGHRFQPQTLSSLSLLCLFGAGILCEWVIQTTSFHRVYRRVQPIMQMLEDSTEAKKQAEADLDAIEADLRKV